MVSRREPQRAMIERRRLGNDPARPARPIFGTDSQFRGWGFLVRYGMRLALRFCESDPDVIGHSGFAFSCELIAELSSKNLKATS